eukprot:Nitzschia sp. Nitz4//scaffold52_size167869//36846//41910//NITZ4_002266-RA/size167869-processed-gene-0.121-mRNA-1//-1//CDS//3329554005//2323//frame0
MFRFRNHATGYHSDEAPSDEDENAFVVDWEFPCGPDTTLPCPLPTSMRSPPRRDLTVRTASSPGRVVPTRTNKAPPATPKKSGRNPREIAKQNTLSTTALSFMTTSTKWETFDLEQGIFSRASSSVSSEEGPIQKTARNMPSPGDKQPPSSVQEKQEVSFLAPRLPSFQVRPSPATDVTQPSMTIAAGGDSGDDKKDQDSPRARTASIVTNSTELKTSDGDEHSCESNNKDNTFGLAAAACGKGLTSCCESLSEMFRFSRSMFIAIGVMIILLLAMGIALIVLKSGGRGTTTSAANAGAFSPTMAPTTPSGPASTIAPTPYDSTSSGAGTGTGTGPTTTAAPVSTGGSSPTGPVSPPSHAPSHFFDGDITDGTGDNTGDDSATVEDDDDQDVTFDDEDDSYVVSGDYLVGAYYYPWYGPTFHRGDGYVREELEPQQLPTLGEYDDSLPSTVAQHLKWSRQANIGLWITSWWGPNRLEDDTTKDVILEHEDLGDMKIAVHYETVGRLKAGLSAVVSDMDWLCQNYWNHDNYYKINGRPVMFVYVTRKLESDGLLEQTILAMRTEAGKCGHQVYIIGDQVFDDPPDVNKDYVPFWYFDAVTNYDVYGSMGQPSPYAGEAVVDEYYSDQEAWRTRAIANNCRFVPAVSPGYNDRGVRLEADHPPLSRKLSANEPEGSLFAYQITQAKELVDPQLDNLLVVNSFNEWHEDTQIEPASGERTNLPTTYTGGVYYEGYGELYLDILRSNQQLYPKETTMFNLSDIPGFNSSNEEENFLGVKWGDWCGTDTTVPGGAAPKTPSNLYQIAHTSSCRVDMAAKIAKARADREDRIRSREIARTIQTVNSDVSSHVTQSYDIEGGEIPMKAPRVVTQDEPAENPPSPPSSGTVPSSTVPTSSDEVDDEKVLTRGPSFTTDSTESKASEEDGSSQNEEQEESTKAPITPWISRKRCIVLLGLLLFFGVGIAVGFLIFRSNDNETTMTAANSGNTAPSLAHTAAPTTSPTEAKAPTSSPTTDEYFWNDDDAFAIAGSYLVGAYYYPWYGSTFHRNDGYVREELEPKHVPTLGEYDDSRPSTVAQHLKWSRQANIGLWITSWWGPNRLEDDNTREVILAHEHLGDLKIAVHYETSGRLKYGQEAIVSDMEWLCEHYWSHDNYYKVNGRPVMFVYVTRKLESEGILEETILTMRTAAGKCGHQVYIVGDQVFDNPPDVAEDYVPFWYFDAVTNYDVYGSMGRPAPYAGEAAVDEYYSDQRDWRTRAIASKCRFIPTVSPGYNDRGVRLEADHPALSRKLTEDAEDGSLFAYQLTKARKLVDPELDNLLVVNSFNEWHEDTQIEPVVGERTNEPFNYTEGLYYEGYGELYLDLLRYYTAE